MADKPDSTVAILDDTTQLLLAARDGDQAAVEALFQQVYQHLRQIAHRELMRGSRGATLNTTALVHEAYLKLFDSSRLAVNDRRHFLAVAARAMRQVIVDHFRSRSAQKRGGQHYPVDIHATEIPVDERGDVMLALDEALDRLSTLNSRLSDVVTYQFFGEAREALRIRRGALGDQHADVARSLDRVGQIRLARDDPEGAIRLISESLSIRRKIFGDTHRDVAESLDDLGLAYAASGEARTAERFLMQGYDMRRSLYSSDHPLVKESIDHIETFLERLGDDDRLAAFHAEINNEHAVE